MASLSPAAMGVSIPPSNVADGHVICSLHVAPVMPDGQEAQVNVPTPLVHAPPLHGLGVQLSVTAPKKTMKKK